MDGISKIGVLQMQSQLAMAEAGRGQGTVEKAARSVAGAKAGQLSDAEKDQRLLKTCKDFESIFLAYLMKSMRDTVPKGDLLGDSKASEIFNSMRDDELAKNMASSGGIGIYRLLYDQMRKTL